jgi:hypothetical protein
MFSCGPQGHAVDGNIIVFGKPIDETEHLGKRRSALPPLNRSSGIPCKVKKCFRVQETQTSFSTAVNRCASRTVFLPDVRQRLGFRVRGLVAGVDILECKRRRA